MIGFIKRFFVIKMRRFKLSIQAHFVTKKQKTKCYSNSTHLFFPRQHLVQMLPWQDKKRPCVYLGKVEVECGNTASLMSGSPVARTREIDFQVVLYMYVNFIIFNTADTYMAKHLCTDSVVCFQEVLLLSGLPPSDWLPS